MLSPKVLLLPATILAVQFCCTYGLTVDTLDKVGQVVFVSVLYRHGDRTPIDPYPNDPYGNLSYWPVSWGQLTNKGKELHYEQGQWLRFRYNYLLGPEYKKENIYVQSTDVDRTLMSAESNLAGMFPPIGKQVWNTIQWQPIPVHTVPEKQDKVLAMKFPCKKYEQELHLAKNSDFMKSVDAKYKGLYEYLTLHAGQEYKSVEEVDYLYSNLHIESLFNFTLPEWTRKVYPEPLRTASTISFIIPTLNKKLQRLKSGPLLGQMVKHMKDKRSGTLNPDRKMWVYSAHDTTVANFLNTLGVYNMINPPYAATVLLELRKDIVGQYFVTLLYKNCTNTEMVLTVPGCSEACPLDTFASLYEEVIPTDWDAECHAHHLFDLTSDLPYNSLAIFAMVTSTLLVFLLLASTSLYWHRQQAPSHLYRKLKMETL